MDGIVKWEGGCERGGGAQRWGALRVGGAMRGGKAVTPAGVASGQNRSYRNGDPNTSSSSDGDGIEMIAKAIIGFSLILLITGRND